MDVKLFTFAIIEKIYTEYVNTIDAVNTLK